MSATDAFTIGESWISEHFFMSDSPKESFHARVLARRKEMDASAKAGEETTRGRFIANRRALLAAFTALSEHTDVEQLQDLYRAELDSLGYSHSGAQFQPDGAVTRVSPCGTEAAPLWIVEARPVTDVTELLSKDVDTLLAPFERENGDKVTSVARLLSLAFVDDDAPEFALVLSGGLALIAEQHRWPEGRYLAIDLALVCDRNDEKRGGEIDTMLACLSAESLAPDADGNMWWKGVLTDSVAHTVGVSKDLRDAVRLSIEIIGNEVVRQREVNGLAPLPSDQAQPLAKQALRFLYRILFLLYAEASPELGVLPVGDPTYQRGYSLDRLRELTQVQLTDPHEREGRHLYESLKLLFDLVDRGHEAPEVPGRNEGLTFHSLRADLFRPEATALIDEVGLSNVAMQRILANLLLSKASTKEQRGFISYAELGINQLGEVYEGLMSYTGFFAHDDLNEVAPNGDSSKGSWVVPVSQARELRRKDFVTQADPLTGEPVPVRHRRGSFVFRLSGRDRQQSASYYTPEVLTHFTVQQALEELLDRDATTPAADILRITVCEPALGSGAFAIEATRQLAEQYLQRRQKELGRTIDPDQYPLELQRVKTYIALHNVYGVDLNATAVELAEITLWLDTMARGLHAPWFGLHLRRGNSLIGCRRAVFRPDQVKDGSWLTNVPQSVSLYSPDENIPSIGSGIHYFLLPAQGWGASSDAKAAKELAPEALARLKAWRRSLTHKPNHTQLQELTVLAERVERLWAFAIQRLAIAEAQVRRTVPVWGAEGLAEGGAVTREEIEESLANPAGAFQRLKAVMDAWNALWFWPLADSASTQNSEASQRIDPPSFSEWLATLKDLLGHKPEATSTGGKQWKGGDATLASAAAWNELGAAEEMDLAGAGAATPHQVFERHPWLGVCRDIAQQQGFFHWELMFGHVFHANGGFDLQVGNPPWVRPRDDDAALLAEFDPWWQLTTKPPVAEVKRRRHELLAHRTARAYFLSAAGDLAAQRAAVSAPHDFALLNGLQPDLYRCFMVQTWRHSSAHGTVGLIHPETHFTDEAAGLLRQHTYQRLRRHWQFDNELMLFDIDHHVTYGVHVYGSARTPHFIQATSLYHPDTAIRSLVHDGSGPEPGLKDLTGHWDLRPHKSRIIHVTPQVLAVWRNVLEAAETPPERTRMVYTVNSSVLDVLVKASQTGRIGDLHPLFSAGWHETADFNRGRFVKEWGRVSSWDDAILQGPHLHVSLPFFKFPNKTMKHNQDWTGIDLEALAADELSITSYKPAGSREAYESQYTHWKVGGRVLAARDYYRIAWRGMAANTGERTLIPALIPPGAAHIHGVSSLGLPNGSPLDLVVLEALLSSIVCDLTVRIAPKSTIPLSAIARLPWEGRVMYQAPLALRALQLNCLTDAYAPLWRDVLEEIAAEDSLPASITDEGVLGWTGGIDYPGRWPLCAIEEEWTPESRLTRASDRRQALVEIDALVALGLGISADELCSVYRTQFGVLYGYDHERDYYDANGRLVPKSVIDVWKKKGDTATEMERTTVHPQSGVAYVYELPFRLLDREEDMRRAYETFGQRLGYAQ